MKDAGSVRIIPTPYLSETKVVKHQGAVPLLDGIIALRETQQTAQVIPVTDRGQQGIISRQEPECNVRAAIEYRSVADMISIALFRDNIPEPGIERGGRAEEA